MVIRGGGEGRRVGLPRQLRQLEDRTLDCRLVVMPVDLMHVGVGMADDKHADFLGYVLALKHCNHGMPETVEALLGKLMLPFRVAGVYAGLAHDADELLAIAGPAAWLELADLW